MLAIFAIAFRRNAMTFHVVWLQPLDYTSIAIRYKMIPTPKEMHEKLALFNCVGRTTLIELLLVCLPRLKPEMCIIPMLFFFAQ